MRTGGPEGTEPGGTAPGDHAPRSRPNGHAPDDRARDDRAPGTTADLLGRLLQRTAAAVDADDVLEQTAALLVGGLADWVVADRLAEPDLVVRVAAIGPRGPLHLPAPSGSPQARRSSATAAGGLLGVLHARAPGLPAPLVRLGAADLAVLSASPDARLRAQAELAASLDTVDTLVIGTVARGRLNGVLSLGRTSGPFTAEALALLQLVALQVGLALDAARLLEAQRSVSAAMQRSLLPPLPQVRGLEIAARYQTAAQGLDVGGDWYDAFRLVDGGVAVVIGDATGHDTAAAASMAGLRNQLRALALDRGEQPAATLTRLDRTGSLLGEHASATCLYARLDAAPDGSGWTLRWSSAGHLPPVLVRDGTATVAHTPPDLMLGVDPDSPRKDHEVRLAAGDLVLLCTDGLVEDRRTPLDERLEDLRVLVARHAGEPPETLADALLAALAVDSDDDVALLVVRTGHA